MGRRLIVVVLISGLALAAAPSALAHGLHVGSDSIPGMVWLGIRHMLGGWDHLLFIVGIVLLARDVRLAAKLISLFVLGHSTTLLVATLAGWELNADAVDVVIASSVAYIGWRVLRGQPARWAPTGLVILLFGLVHGLGLSTRLQAVDLPEGTALVLRIIAFNIGVEIGQLLALAVIVAVGVIASRRSPSLRALTPQLAAGLVAFGVLTALALGFIAVRAGAITEDPSALSAGACVEREYEIPAGAGLAGGHPGQSFYSPGTGPPLEDLEHALGHGFTIVYYRNTSPTADRRALADWTDDYRYAIVVPSLKSTQFTVEALKPGGRLTCNMVDLAALSRFTTQ